MLHTMADGRVVAFNGDGLDLSHSATSLLHVAWRGGRYELAGGQAGWGIAAMDSSGVRLTRDDVRTPSGHRLVVGRGQLHQTATDIREQIEAHRSQDPLSDPPSSQIKDVDVEVAYASLETENWSVHSQAYGSGADHRLIALFANSSLDDTPAGPVVTPPTTAQLYEPCSLVKWVPRIGLLHVWDRRNVSKIDGKGTPVAGGSLRYFEREDRPGHFILVGDSTYTTVMPDTRTSAEDSLMHLTSLRVAVVPNEQ